MNRASFYFERQEFKADNIQKPFYVYKGYSSLSEEGEYCPITLHFGKDEIVFSYCDKEGRVSRLYSLYVAEGELNQRMLTEKVQNYWKMPLWPSPRPEEYEKGKGEFFVEPGLLSISYFSSQYEVDVEISEDEGVRFQPCRLFDRKKRRQDFYLEEEELQFCYVPRRQRDKDKKDIWRLEDKDKKIITRHINFRKILLDFLYELEYTTTFEDENFFNLQPALQDNKLLDALSRKCRYLDELNKLRDYRYRPTVPHKRLPKKFHTAEESWLNVCFMDTYEKVFTSFDSLFKSAEDEVEDVIFKAKIGTFPRKRTDYFTKEDSRLRNQAATFFLRRYSLYNAFRSLMHPALTFVLPVFLLLVPLGDIMLNEKIEVAKPLIGLFGVGLPVLALVGLVIHYAVTHINLFKLVLPRLFLGIMLGWSIFCTTEELWKEAVIAHWERILALDLVLFVILFLYIFTDIRNKLVRITETTILSRTAGLIFLAMLISFLQGFYVLQFKAEPMLENSGFLTKDNLQLRADCREDENKIEILKFEENRKLFGVSNYSPVDTPKWFPGGSFRFHYIWSVHLSQLMMSILIGVVLQLLWEDRPITEPL